MTVLVEKLAAHAAHIRSLALDMVFIVSLVWEDGPFLVADVISYEVGRLRSAAADAVQTWFRKERK